MEYNPYAAPGAVVDDMRGPFVEDMESRKATRGKRLGAALLDGLIMLLPGGLAAAGGIMEWNARRAGIPSSSVGGLLLFLGAVAALAVLVVNCVMIHRSGQTMGKRMLDIAVVRSDGDRIGLGRYILLRVIVVSLLGVIPLVGRFIGLIDVLLIFGKERRCLHDLIADTIVVDV